MSVTRQDRDWKDTNTVLRYLSDRNPFTSDIALQNISTGVHAHSSIDVDQATTVGKAILNGMKGQCVMEYTFRRENQAITMDMKSSIKIDGNTVQIDPQLLFQRLALAAKATQDLEAVFKYESCSYPPALFEPLLREAQKPALADAIWSLLQTPNTPAVSGQVQYVLDGGALLQRIPWKKGVTYSEILGTYTEYVTRKYGHAIVVFDDYLKSKIGATMTFTEKNASHYDQE